MRVAGDVEDLTGIDHPVVEGVAVVDDGVGPMDAVGFDEHAGDLVGREGGVVEARLDHEIVMGREEGLDRVVDLSGVVAVAEGHVSRVVGIDRRSHLGRRLS
jgi:hypothetical protein